MSVRKARVNLTVEAEMGEGSDIGDTAYWLLKALAKQGYWTVTDLSAYEIGDLG